MLKNLSIVIALRKRKDVQQEINNKLQETEKEINKIVEELHELVGSEEKNRTGN